MDKFFNSISPSPIDPIDYEICKKNDRSNCQLNP